MRTQFSVQVRDKSDSTTVQQIFRDLGSEFITTDEDNTYQTRFSNAGLTLMQAARLINLSIIRRRLDPEGTKEPIIQRQGVDRILVQLPGVDDPEAVKRLLGRTAKLTFSLLTSV